MATSNVADWRPKVSLSECLRSAVSSGDVVNVERLIDSGILLGPDKDGRTLLHIAAQNGHLSVVKALIVRSFDVGIRDKLGYTALHRASAQGHVQVVKVLLKRNCSVNAQDECGNTALHAAAWNGCSQTANLLICNEADVTVANKTGCTALHLAAQKGHNQCARVLLYAGCSPDVKNNNGDTALHHAAKFGHAGIIRILLSAKCKVSVQNKVGETPLHIAVTNLHQKVAVLLIEEGINYKTKNKKGNTALDIAKKLNNKELILLMSSRNKGRFLSLMKRKIVSKGVKLGSRHHSDDRSDTGVGLVCGRVLHDRTHSPEPVSSTTSGVAPSAQYSCDLGPLNLLDENTSISSPEPTDFIGELARDFHGVRVNDSDEQRTKFVCNMKPDELLAGFCEYRMKSANTKIETSPVDRVKPVKGLVDYYLAQPGVQYYKDLAGNVKRGPVGYTPLTTREAKRSPMRKACKDDFYESFGSSPQKHLVQTLERCRQRQRSSLALQQQRPLEHLNGDWDRREFVDRWHEHINLDLEYLDQENTPNQLQRNNDDTILKHRKRETADGSKLDMEIDVYSTLPGVLSNLDSNASRERNEKQVYGLREIGFRTRNSQHRPELGYSVQADSARDLASDYHTRSTMPIRSVSKRSSNGYLRTNAMNVRQSFNNDYDSDSDAMAKPKFSRTIRNKRVVRRDHRRQKEFEIPRRRFSRNVSEARHSHVDRYDSRVPFNDDFNDPSVSQLRLFRTLSDDTLSTYSRQRNNEEPAKLNRRPVASRSRLRNAKSAKPNHNECSYLIASPISPFDDIDTNKDDSRFPDFNEDPCYPGVSVAAKKMRPFWDLKVQSRVLPGDPFHSVPQDSSTPVTCREKAAAGNSSTLLDTPKSDDSPGSQLPAAPAASPVSDGLTTMSLPPPEALVIPSPPGSQPQHIPSEQLHSTADCGSNPDSGYDGSKIYRASATLALNHRLQMSYMDLIGVETIDKEVPSVPLADTVGSQGMMADMSNAGCNCYMQNTTAERAIFSPVRGSSSNVVQSSVGSNSDKEHWSFRRIDLVLNDDDVKAEPISSHILDESGEEPSKSVAYSDLGETIVTTETLSSLKSAREDSGPKHITTPVIQCSSLSFVDASVQCSSISDDEVVSNCKDFSEKFVSDNGASKNCNIEEVTCSDNEIVKPNNNYLTSPSSVDRSKPRIVFGGIGRSTTV